MAASESVPTKVGSPKPRAADSLPSPGDSLPPIYAQIFNETPAPAMLSRARGGIAPDAPPDKFDDNTSPEEEDTLKEPDGEEEANTTAELATDFGDSPVSKDSWFSRAGEPAPERIGASPSGSSGVQNQNSDDDRRSALPLFAMAAAVITAGAVLLAVITFGVFALAGRGGDDPAPEPIPVVETAAASPSAPAPARAATDAAEPAPEDPEVDVEPEPNSEGTPTARPAPAPPSQVEPAPKPASAPDPDNPWGATAPSPRPQSEPAPAPNATDGTKKKGLFKKKEN